MYVGGEVSVNFLHVTAMVERAAMIVAGVQALGGPVTLPEKVDRDFNGVYKCLREN